MTTTTALVLWTNELPPAELNPNASGRHAKGEANAHGRRWSAEQEARKWYRELLANRWQTFVRVEQERGRIPFELPLAHARVSVTAEFCWRRRQPAHQAKHYRPNDVPNLIFALKPLYDALQDAGAIVGDSFTQLEFGPHRIIAVGELAFEGITVELEPWP